MLGMVSNFNRQAHTFVGGEIGAFVRGLAEKSKRDLCVIRYERLGVFCIIEMVSPNRDIFIDIMNLGKSLGNFDRKKAHELNMRLFRPVTCDETSRYMFDADSDYHHTRQEWNSEETERLEKCARGE